MLQDYALRWLMGEELEAESRVEEERMKYTILAGQPQLYAKLWPDREEDEDIEWVTPQSEQEAAEIAAMFERGMASDPALRG